MHRYSINIDEIVVREIDGTLIILHEPSGHFFSAEQSGAILIALLAVPRTMEELVKELHARTTDAPDRESLRSDIQEFLNRLARSQLLIETE